MAQGIKQQKGGGVMWKLGWVVQDSCCVVVLIHARRLRCVEGSDGSSAGTCWDVWDVQCLPAFIPKMNSKLQVVTVNSVKGLEGMS